MATLARTECVFGCVSLQDRGPRPEPGPGASISLERPVRRDAAVSCDASRARTEEGGTTPVAIERVRKVLKLKHIGARRCAKECVTALKQCGLTAVV